MSKSAPGNRYRFVILIVYMFVTMAIEIQWLAHAAVARPAELFYKGQFNPESIFNIDFLAMSYMIVFLILSFPASYIIDTLGIKTALTIGAILAAVFSLTKAIFFTSFTGVIISQIGLAVAQPLIINAVTALTVRWFPLNERALAGGLAILAQYLGFIVAMLVTPLIVGSNPLLANYGSGFGTMLWVYAIFSVVASIFLILFIKEKPANSTFEATERYSFMKGLTFIMKQRDMLLTILLFCIGLGIMNAVSSMTDSLTEYLGVKDSNGLIGGLMLIGGIIGSIIIPALSDKYMKRKLFLVVCMLGMVPGVLGLSFANYFGFSSQAVYTIALGASFILGFFVMSAGPVGFQYAAEICHPAPESTSQGILLWVGQISGILFVFGMSVRNNIYLPKVMVVFSILAILSFIVVLFVKESNIREISTK
jgi:MFS family permease